jgi:hypothetical protein
MGAGASLPAPSFFTMNGSIKKLPPPSAVEWFDALLALPVIVGGFFLLRSYAMISDAMMVAFLVLGLGVAMGALEIIRAPWRATPRTPRKVTDILGATFIKLTGFVSAALLIGFAYWLFPEYDRTYYAKFFETVFLVLPYTPFVIIPYFLFVEWRLLFCGAPQIGTCFHNTFSGGS